MAMLDDVVTQGQQADGFRQGPLPEAACPAVLRGLPGTPSGAVARSDVNGDSGVNCRNLDVLVAARDMVCR